MSQISKFKNEEPEFIQTFGGPNCSEAIKEGRNSTNGEEDFSAEEPTNCRLKGDNDTSNIFSTNDNMILRPSQVKVELQLSAKG